MSERLQAPRPLALLVDDGLALALGGGWDSYWWAAAPLAALSAVFSSLSVQWLQALTGADPAGLAEACGSLLLVLLLAPIAMLAAVLVYAALHAAAAQRVCLGHESPAAAWRFAVRPTTIATLLLALVAVLIASALTFLLLFLPGVVLAGLFGVVVPVMVVEGRVGPEALSRSARLLWHNPEGRFLSRPLVKVLAILLLYMVVANALGLLVGLPYQVLSQAMMFRRLIGGEAGDPASVLGPLLWLQVPTQIVASLVSTWVAYYVGFCLALFYRDLLACRQGDDLERLLDSLVAESRGEA